MASSDAAAAETEPAPRLVLPCEDREEWSRVESILRRPLASLADLDAVLTEFAAPSTQQTCTFFSTVPGSADAGAGKLDFDAFWAHGVPLMLELALEMPTLFAGVELPLLLRGANRRVALSRRQCACLLAHSFFGSITEKSWAVEKKKWAFRVAQLFFLEALPSALCVLNYFKVLGQRGIPEGTVTIERRGFPRRAPPWRWEGNGAPLCPIEFHDTGTIEDSPAEAHADFANRFVGGGCLENDFMMEEILFVVKPELVVAMALCSYMHDEEAIRVAGAMQYSGYRGYASTFEFDGDYDERRAGPPAVVCAMDALQGCARIQFGEGLVSRDLNKARVAFDGARTVATGNWGCGAFGNDHVLKMLQQWLAASDAGAARLHYYTFGDRRSAPIVPLARALRGRTVGELYSAVRDAARKCAGAPGASAKFRLLMEEHAAAIQPRVDPALAPRGRGAGVPLEL